MTALVAGQVQGIGYRAFARRQALDLGLSGYAENLIDGRVEVVAEGHRRDLEHLLIGLRQGPAHAIVRSFDVEWGEAGQLEDFHTY